MKKKKKDPRTRPPKIRRTWKIKPYTRVHDDGKQYGRRKQRAEEEREIAEALQGEGPGGQALHANQASAGDQASGPALRFCPRCGGSLESREVVDRRRLVCSRCDFILYRNPVPAVAAIIPRDGRIVLVRRAEEPLRGDWCLPAGFLEIDETPEECAVRETREETGLDIRVTSLFGVDIGRDDPRSRVVLIVYLAELLGGKLRAGDDASEAGWFGSGELPGRIAFATHRRTIARYFGDDHDHDTGP
jgi:ADP-ribose pyrophosphatase YjhB (NUDIX family)